MEKLKKRIENAWKNREILKDKETINCINTIIEEVDKGKLRIAEPFKDDWKTNEWIKKAIILYFPIRKMQTLDLGPLEFHDKMKIKKRL